MSVNGYGKVYLIGAGPGNPNYLAKRLKAFNTRSKCLLL